MIMRIPLIAATLALLVPGANLAAAPTVELATKQVRYTVKRGDTLFSLWTNYFTGPAAVRQVQRLNGIADPRRIPVGTVLTIPRNLLRDETTQAKIEAFSGPVTIRRGGVSHTAQLNEILREGDEIDCGRNAFATLRLADNSALAIPSQSTLQLSRLRKVKLTGALERDISVKAGRVRAKAAPMTNPDSSFRVITPVAVSAVRGTEFRVGFDESEAFSASQVDEGKVAFAGSPGSSELDLPAGFGAADAKGKPTGVVKLIAAPKLAAPDKVQSDERLNFALVPLTGATRYHLQIAKDAGFLEAITEDNQVQPVFDLPSIPSESYFVRVSAFDQYGLEGTADTYSFERRLNLVKAGVDGGAPGERKLRFKWDGTVDGTPQYRFQLIRKGQPDVPVVDAAGLSENLLSISNLPPGDYQWRVCSILLVKGKVVTTWTAPQSLHVSKPQ
jgi:hypothetical protein